MVWNYGSGGVYRPDVIVQPSVTSIAAAVPIAAPSPTNVKDVIGGGGGRVIPFPRWPFMLLLWGAAASIESLTVDEAARQVGQQCRAMSPR